ncbi:hypothetical protein A5784_20960 [Mycobacterium sp. 852013-50091_SCH5140682]|uniref:hypothetical protein n=1 Tax=Mycobacterium sp. 852013-50091_SCH5140682 TaxID=1834109 RepID=UPI0007EA77E3|nr:hypothetical protein [Mycobacterium sp. 852013-50091_SCH5140682]OBC00011.1 hypothetical protein A5784_20960 [Mycobacterium sp. 852013-50091_SCH5140682]
MQGPPEARVLALWEAAADTSPLLRTLTLAAAGGAPSGGGADLSIGQRDGYLLAMRQECFGSTFACIVNCPECGAELELELTAADLAVRGGDRDRATLTVDGAVIEFRAITSRDLLAVAGRPAARRDLIHRCITAGGAGPLPDSTLDQLSAAMAALDPQADVSVEIDCAVCEHRWAAPFDIAGYLWAELNTHALRILREVHELASLYGWSEAEVLAVSPARRRRYLEMATS